jgi:hypothetical protein
LRANGALALCDVALLIPQRSRKMRYSGRQRRERDQFLFASRMSANPLLRPGDGIDILLDCSLEHMPISLPEPTRKGRLGHFVKHPIEDRVQFVPEIGSLGQACQLEST